jgi:hypothetical protein
MPSLRRRLVAAVLVPLVACAPQVQVRHRDGVAPEVVRQATGASTIQVAEAEFTPAFRTVAQGAPTWADPLETARHLFQVPERSGTYRYEVRTRRLIPVAEGEPMLGVTSEQEFIRDYLQWCGTTLEPGDCLQLLGKNRPYSSHARYATAMAIGWRSSLGQMRATLRGMVTPAALMGTIVAAVTMYLMLWVAPEPFFTKGIAAAMTVWLIGYFGFDPLWRLAKAWRGLVDEADEALDFEALRKAGERFGERAGPAAARLLILVTTVAIGGTAGMAAKGGSLPGFALASAQAEGQLGVSLATATAAESVLVGTQTVTITFAPGLLAMAAAEQEATGFLGSRRAPLGNAPYQRLQNGDAVIGGRTFSGHALDQMRNRGLTPSLVENTIQTGIRSPDPIAGRLRHFDPVNKITVITEEGRVVTVIPGRPAL